MGFGAVITSGAANTPLREDLAQWLVEARVEQELSKPTRFAIRFEEDICDDCGSAVMNTAELQPSTIMAVLVPVGRGGRPTGPQAASSPAAPGGRGNEYICLARGPITEVKCSMVLGGPGSWVEVHCEDRRVEMDRVCVQAAWRVRASDAATKILAAYGFTPKVQQTRRVYSDDDRTLNQRATDLDFIEQIARENNLEFWIEYEVGPALAAIPIVEVANLRSSPERPEGPAGVPVPLPQLTLAPTRQLALRVHVEDERCPNVTAFDLKVDVERPKAARGAALNDRQVSLEGTQAVDVQPSTEPEGARLIEIDDVERTLCVTTAGDADELQRRQEAALTEAGWFVEATASTTAHMLGGVLAPHDVIKVEGLGPRHEGAYQVKGVVHVINAADHFMDVRLRRNVIGRC